MNGNINNIEKINEHIASEASLEIEAIKAEAAAQVAEIKDRYAKIAEAETRTIINKGRQNAENRMERLISASHLEAKKLVLAEKQNCIEEVFSKALAKLIALPAEQYTVMLASFAAEAAQSGDEEIILNARDYASYGKDIMEKANAILQKANRKAALSLSAQTGSFAGGLILSGSNAQMNCTLEAMLQEMRGNIASEVARKLFD